MDKRSHSGRWLLILLLFVLSVLTIWSGSIVIQRIDKNNALQTTIISKSILKKDNSETLIVGGDDAYPPFSYLEDGVAKGFDNDLMRAMAQVMGMKVEFRLTSWAEAKQDLQDGKVDVIGGMVPSDLREKDLLFGSPHAILYYDLFVRRNSEIHSIDDIQGKSIIVQEGDIMEEYLKESGYSCNIIQVEDPKEALVTLASGKYDGALLSEIQGYYFIDLYRLSNIKGLGEELTPRDYGFAVNKTDRLLLIKLNQAFGIIQTSGTYDELSDKWLTFYTRTSFLEKNRSLIFAFVAVIGFFLIVLLWGWSLRRQVQKKTRELGENERKYQQLIDNASEGVVVLRDEHFVYYNPKALAIIGNPDTDTIAKKIYLPEIIYPSDLNLVKEHYQKLFSTEKYPTHFTFRIVTLKGDVRCLQSNTVPIEWEGQNALLVFFSDITDERRLEENLKSSEERYRQLFTQTPVGLFYFDKDLKITNLNDRFIEILHSTRRKLEGLDLHTVNDQRFIPAVLDALDHKDGFYEGPYIPTTSEEEVQIYVKLHTTPIMDERMEYRGGIGMIEDITEQVMREHKIKSLEDKFSKVFFTSPDCICISDISAGKIIDVNRGFTEMTGYTRDEVLDRSIFDIHFWVNPEDREKLINEIKEVKEYSNLEMRFRSKDGRIRVGLLSASLIEFDEETCLLAVIRDIDEIKQAEELIRLSEKRYHSIFDNVPVSIWEEDLLEIYDMLEKIRNEGVTDLPEYLRNHPQFVTDAIRSVKINDVNNASLQIFKGKNKEDLFISMERIFTEDAVDNFKRELLAIWEKQTLFEGETLNLDLNGEPIYLNMVIYFPDNREDFRKVLVSIADFSERKKAEEALRESEMRYRQLIEQVNVVVYLDFFGTPNKPQYISPHIKELLGYTAEEWLQDPELYMKVICPEDREYFIAEDLRTDYSGEPFVVEYRATTKEGKTIWIHDEAILETDDKGNPKAWHGVMYDVTLRKNAENALRESEERYKRIFNSVPVSIKEEDFSSVIRMFKTLRQEGVTDISEYIAQNPGWLVKAAESVMITDVNLETLKMFKADSKEQLLQPLSTFFTEESYASFLKQILSFWNGEEMFHQETVNRTIKGDLIDVSFTVTNPAEENDLARTLVTILDITESKKAEEQIRIQLRYLAALRAVDMAISASMDLPITLRVLLNQVSQQLGVDGALILLLDPHTKTLKYSTGIGFSSPGVESINLRLGQSYAGQAALERRIIIADDLQTKSSRLIFKEIIQENYSHYMGVPLVSKGIVKGVLELFNRSPFGQDSAWMNLLESMAGQAGIAIENATLMDEVQKVNVNLRSAYDATIEGWARSLEIRDGEEGNHSRRVADLTIELAQTAGFQGEGLLHMRRGALLHDIGKMGIPDSILQKPGPLSDAEWEIMMTHPLIGKRLLNSIDFLQPAVEIPYSHHERWDGTGYPERLKGTQIPYAARVFAIVDCWDVLRSDRPWRKAWKDDAAWEYIRKNSGKIFDPQLVEKFRQMMGFD